MSWEPMKRYLLSPVAVWKYLVVLAVLLINAVITGDVMRTSRAMIKTNLMLTQQLRACGAVNLAGLTERQRLREHASLRRTNERPVSSYSRRFHYIGGLRKREARS